eukprot:GHUV01027435.1.p1 GENE.GHUV01027435.1~~GHUV01027435.1.p1  ORF type:complete len:111 (+),score=17.44 GHUV01027435.1:2261-2593(+)
MPCAWISTVTFAAVCLSACLLLLLLELCHRYQRCVNSVTAMYEAAAAEDPESPATAFILSVVKFAEDHRYAAKPAVGHASFVLCLRLISARARPAAADSTVYKCCCSASK